MLTDEQLKVLPEDAREIGKHAGWSVDHPEYAILRDTSRAQQTLRFMQGYANALLARQRDRARCKRAGKLVVEWQRKWSEASRERGHWFGHFIKDGAKIEALEECWSRDRKRLEEARAMLKAMEWLEHSDYHDHWYECPSCQIVQRDDDVFEHHLDCKLDKYLAGGKEAEDAEDSR